MFQTFHPDVALSVLTDDHGSSEDEANPKANLRANLQPEELNYYNSLGSEKRQREFALGRHAAREALQKLGLESPGAILRGKLGEPVWPKDFTGSITHSGKVVLAAVSRTTTIRSLGIDLQKSFDEEKANKLLQRIASPTEQAWAKEANEVLLLRTMLIFSAKESFYKALSPLNTSGQVISFLDIELESVNSGTELKGTLKRNIAPDLKTGTYFTVGFHYQEPLVFTHVVIAS